MVEQESVEFKFITHRRLCMIRQLNALIVVMFLFVLHFSVSLSFSLPLRLQHISVFSMKSIKAILISRKNLIKGLTSTQTRLHNSHLGRECVCGLSDPHSKWNRHAVPLYLYEHFRFLVYRSLAVFFNQPPEIQQNKKFYFIRNSREVLRPPLTSGS